MPGLWPHHRACERRGSVRPLFCKGVGFLDVIIIYLTSDHLGRPADRGRYLLDEQSNHFLNLADAHLKAALICLTYLSYSSLDTLFPETEVSGIEGQILGGDFVFLEYAVLEYMEHVKEWMRHKRPQDSAETISAALGRLFDARGNAAFDQSAPSEVFMGEFAPFQAQPALQRSLASAASFLTGARIGMIEVDGEYHDCDCWVPGQRQSC